MKTVDLTSATIPEVTIIPNTIIDHYLLEANGLQLKVYLYISRQTAAGNCVHVSDIADYFNETEKEVSRAIAFWEARNVFSCCKAKQIPLPSPRNSLTTTARHAEALKTPPRVPIAQTISDASVNSMSGEQLADLKDSQEFKELLFVAEAYMGKPLRRNDCNILLFIKYTLNFSNQLIEYLLEYCAELNKKSFHYVQTVACSWAEQGITTPEEAKLSGMMYNKRIYTVMNALGKKGDPSNTELEHIKRWHDEYGFETDVILEACRRTVLATDTHRFSYAEKILSSWYAAGIHHVSDISRADATYQSKKAATKKVPSYVANNPFLQHEQSGVDYAALEKELLQN